MGDEATGLSLTLEIPDSVYTDISKLETKITALQKHATEQATKINTAFTSIGTTGLNNLSQKIKEINAQFSKLGNVKGNITIENSFNNVTAATDTLASSVVSASNAVNQMGVKGTSSLEMLREKIKDIDLVIQQIQQHPDIVDNKQKLVLEGMKIDLKQLSNAQKDYSREMSAQERIRVKETQVNTQRVINEKNAELLALHKEAQQLKLNNVAWDNYAKALMMSEQTSTSRIKKIERLRNVLLELKKDESGYASEIQIVTDKIKQLENENKNLEHSLGGVHREQNKLLHTGQQLRRAFSLLFSVSYITRYIKKVVEVRGLFELQNKALQAIIQNKYEANQLFSQITDLAVKSPFQLKELVTYTKQLAAYRVETSKLYDTTKMLADVSAGLGVDMNRLILAYGQVKAANYLRGQELRQFSEAGINILGELSDYFSELEGKAVSVSDVFDRVSRRMVKFSDVEKIFKRLTEEGGIFFQMQEIQAETVSGMVSNLKDAIDIMVNEIGTNNEKFIKGFINFQRKLVDNYQIFGVVLDSLIAGLTMYIIKLGEAKLMSDANAMSTKGFARAILFLQKVLASVVNAFHNFGAFLNRNKWALIIGALAAIASALIRHNKEIKRARKEYDNLNIATVKARQNLNDIVKTIKESNQAYEEANEQLKGLKEGTEEYEELSKKANDADIERSKALNKLKEDYPELYQKYEESGKELSTLIEIQGEYNEELKETLALNFALESRETWFNKGIINDLKELTEAQLRHNKATRSVDAAYTGLKASVEKLMSVNEEFRTSFEETYNKILNSDWSDEKKLFEIAVAANEIDDKWHRRKYKSDIKDRVKGALDAVREYRRATLKLSGAEGEAQDEINKALDIASNNIDNIKDKIEKGEATADDLTKVTEREKAALTNVAKQLAGSNKDLQEFLNVEIQARLGFRIDFDESKEKLLYLQKQVNEYLDSKEYKEGLHDVAGFKLSDFIKLRKIDDVTEETKSYFKGLRDLYKDNTAVIEKLVDAKAQLFENVKNEDKKAELEEENAALLKILRQFGEVGDLFDKTKDKTKLEIFKEKLQLLKDINKSYEKYRKMYNADVANAKAKADWDDTIKSLKMEDVVATMTFDTQGLIDGIGTITDMVSDEIGKVGSKEMEALKVQVELEGYQEQIDILKTSIQQAFDDFDISKEIIKSGFGEELANILGIEFIDSIDTLREKIATLIQPYVGGENVDKIMKEVDKKLAEREKKQYQEKVRNFQKYLEKTVDEIQAVQDSGALDIKFANEIFDKGLIDVETYTTTLKNIVASVNGEISKIEVEKFKNSAEYIMAMGDMSMYSKEEIEKLVESLEKMIALAAPNLDAKDLKVYTDAIDKAREELNRIENPFDNTFIAQLRDLKKYQDEYNKEIENLNTLTQNQIFYTNELANAKQHLKDIQDNADNNGTEANQEDLDVAKQNVEDAIVNLENANKEVNTSKSRIASLSNAMNKIMGGSSKMMFMIDAIVKGVHKAIHAIVDMFYEIKELADTFGKETDEGKWKKTEIAFQGISEMNDKVLSTWEKFKGGDLLGSFVDSIGAVFSLIKLGNRAVDYDSEMVIKEQIDRVERLQKQYERLERAIDDALSIDEANNAFEASNRNLQNQINSYRAAIAAEEDKKDTDKERLKEFKEDIEDLEEQKRDLAKQKLDFYGGFEDISAMRDFAQELADTWLDSFKAQEDGLDALNKKWDEYINNVIAKQLMLKGLENFLAPIMNELNGMISDGEFSPEEARNLRAKIDQVMPQLNELWTNLAESLGVKMDEMEGGEMSDLQKGIQGITETTAQALESLLNSMRFFVSDSNLQMHKIVNVLMGLDGYPNPMLNELKHQTNIINEINNTLSSVVKGGHPDGGFGLKAFVS